jgi:hypothetical protein
MGPTASGMVQVAFIVDMISPQPTRNILQG